jgi:hypothetical protein
VGTLIRDYDLPAPWPKQRMVCLGCGYREAVMPGRETLLDNLDVALRADREPS